MSSVFLGQKNHLLPVISYNLSLGFSNLIFSLFQSSSGDKPDFHSNKFSSLGPCAEAEGSLLKDVQDKSSPSFHAWADDVLRTKVRETSRPGASARPVGRGFKLAKHTSSSGSHARAVGGVNRLTSNHENLGSPSSSFPPPWGKERLGVGFSSLGPCAEAEGWIDKSINGVKRKDDRKSDD